MKSVNQKRDEGEARNVRWRALSPFQQWQELDRRLGIDIGATRQRTKLRAVLETAIVPPTPVKVKKAR